MIVDSLFFIFLNYRIIAFYWDMYNK